jgi:hypothetical protein
MYLSVNDHVQNGTRVIGSDHQQTWKITPDDQHPNEPGYIRFSSPIFPPLCLLFVTVGFLGFSTLKPISISTLQTLEIPLRALPSSSGKRLPERTRPGSSNLRSLDYESMTSFVTFNPASSPLSFIWVYYPPNMQEPRKPPRRRSE